MATKTAKNEVLHLRFGALAPSIEEQCREQGYTLGENAEKYNGLAKALLDVGWDDLLTNSQLDRAYNKLSDHIAQHCVPLAERGGDGARSGGEDGQKG